MSTRAQIAVRDSSSTMMLYQHSDGYPEGVLPMLERFIKGVRNGEIRDNVSQSAGWMIVWGHEELESDGVNDPLHDRIMGWKASYVEPAPEGLHVDIDFLYVVDLVSKTVKYSGLIDEIIDLQDRLFGHSADPGVLIPVLLELSSLWMRADI